MLVRTPQMCGGELSQPQQQGQQQQQQQQQQQLINKHLLLDFMV